MSSILAMCGVRGGPVLTADIDAWWRSQSHDSAGAMFSRSMEHRYLLWRPISESKRSFIVLALNPSTADHRDNDATVRRCIAYAKREGCGRSATCLVGAPPSQLLVAHRKGEPVVGVDNDAVLRHLLAQDDALIVGAWGAVHSHLAWRVDEVRQLVGARQLQCFGTTKRGQPLHPVRLAKARPLVPFVFPEVA